MTSLDCRFDGMQNSGEVDRSWGQETLTSKAMLSTEIKVENSITVNKYNSKAVLFRKIGKLLVIKNLKINGCLQNPFSGTFFFQIKLQVFSS